VTEGNKQNMTPRYEGWNSASFERVVKGTKCIKKEGQKMKSKPKYERQGQERMPRSSTSTTILRNIRFIKNIYI
jgi:hypothetical protein